VGQQIAVALLPYVEMGIAAVTDFGVNGKTSAGIVASAIDGIAYALSAVHDAVLVVKATFGLFAAGVTVSIANIVEAGAALYGLLAKLPGPLQNFARQGQVELEEFAKTIDAVADELAKTAKEDWVGANLRDTLPKKIAEMRALAEAAAKADLAARGANGAVAAFGKNADLLKMGEQLRNSLVSPLQAAQAELDKLSALFEMGELSANQYAMGIGKAVDALEAAHGLGEHKLTGASQRNTVEAQSVIIKSENQERFNKESPQDRLRRIAEQSVEIERQQLEYQKRIADALGAKPKIARI
jgi:hypothetical protein